MPHTKHLLQRESNSGLDFGFSPTDDSEYNQKLTHNDLATENGNLLSFPFAFHNFRFRVPIVARHTTVETYDIAG